MLLLLSSGIVLVIVHDCFGSNDSLLPLSTTIVLVIVLSSVFRCYFYIVFY